MGVGTKLQVDVICALDGTLREVCADQLGQVATHLVRKRELAVREGASAAEARGDAARLAVDAVADLLLGAAAPLDGQALLHHGDGVALAALQQLQSAEDARWARADDEHVG